MSPGRTEKNWWTWPGSNQRPPAKQVLSQTELHAHPLTTLLFQGTYNIVWGLPAMKTRNV
jgi:hypothetical protein